MSFSAERQQHRLLEPLIDRPVAVGALPATRTSPRSSRSSAVSDRVAHRALGRGADAVALLECVVDGLGKLGVRHGTGFLGRSRARFVEGRAGDVKAAGVGYLDPLVVMPREGGASSKSSSGCPHPGRFAGPWRAMTAGRWRNEMTGHRRAHGAVRRRSGAGASSDGRRHADDLLARPAVGARASGHRARSSGRRHRGRLPGGGAAEGRAAGGRLCGRDHDRRGRAYRRGDGAERRGFRRADPWWRSA